MYDTVTVLKDTILEMQTGYDQLKEQMRTEREDCALQIFELEDQLKKTQSTNRCVEKEIEQLRNENQLLKEQRIVIDKNPTKFHKLERDRGGLLHQNMHGQMIHNVDEGINVDTPRTYTTIKRTIITRKTDNDEPPMTTFRDNYRIRMDLIQKRGKFGDSLNYQLSRNYQYRVRS